MKKILLITMLSLGAQGCVLPVLRSHLGVGGGNDITFKIKPIEKRENSSYIGSMMMTTGRALKHTYVFLDDHLDYILTSKGVKKTAALLLPFIIIYAHYFGLDPLKEVAKSLLNTVGRAQAYYYLQVKIGQNDQLIQEISEQPWSMFCMASLELIKSMGKKLKLPYIM